MTATDDLQKELFQEKSLFAVFLKSITYGENRFDQVVKYGSAFLLLCGSIYLWRAHLDLFPVALKALRSWLSMGFTYALTILGFLVAGFTIFATMTKVEIFIALTLTYHKKKNVSQIRFIFYSFLRVFITHIILLGIALAVTMLRDCSPILISAMPLSVGESVLLKKIFVSFLVPLIGYALIEAVLQLKTFVWNLYQSIIVAVAGAVRLYEEGQRNNV